MKAMLPALLVALSGCGAAAGTGPERAQVIFNDNCATCHQLNGQGDHDIKAPAIGGLPQWYVEAQLHKFRKGIRGAHSGDIAGLRMRPMSRTIDETDIPAIAAVVAALPVANNIETHLPASANSESGKQSYATCAACHGQKGEGNEALNAPPISQLDGWYVATQLHNFKSGVRGAHPKDTTGQQMAPMAKTLADDQAVINVAAYIQTL